MKLLLQILNSQEKPHRLDWTSDGMPVPSVGDKVCLKGLHYYVHSREFDYDYGIVTVTLSKKKGGTRET